MSRNDVEQLANIPSWEWPTDAGATVIEGFRDRGAAETDRLLAVELAGDLCAMDDEVAEALLAILQDDQESESLRGQAAITLGPVLELGDEHGFTKPEFVPISETRFHRDRNSVREIFESTAAPKQLRRRALEASVRAPQDWHAGAIRQAYSSGDEEIALAADDALAALAAVGRGQV